VSLVKIRVKSGKYLTKLPFNSFLSLSNLAEAVAEDLGSFLRIILFDSHHKGESNDLILQFRGHLFKRRKDVLRMGDDPALRTNGLLAGLAVGVDLQDGMLFTARNPSHLHFALQRVMKWNQLVRGGHLQLVMRSHTVWAKILSAVNTVSSGIFFTSLTLHLVGILNSAAEGLGERINEHSTSKRFHSPIRHLAHTTPQWCRGYNMVNDNGYREEETKRETRVSE